MRMLDFCCWIFSIKLSRRELGVKKFLKAINLNFELIFNRNYFFHFSLIFILSPITIFRHLNFSAHLNSLGDNKELNCSFRFSCDQQSAQKERIVFLLLCFWACHCINDNMLQLKKKWKKRSEKKVREKMYPVRLFHQSLLLLLLFFLLSSNDITLIAVKCQLKIY